MLDSAVHQTGTSIIIDCQNDNFTDIEFSNFYEQIYKLKYITTASLISQDTFLNKDAKEGENTILIEMGPKGILVEDYATGIPLNVVFQSLFVPSLSTKTISMQPKSTGWKNNTRIITDFSEKMSFIITVNNIVIVEIGLDSTGANYSPVYLLDMPPDTPLPVSRDDIILNETSQKYLYNSMMILYSKSIEMSKVDEIYTALNKYKNYTSSPGIKDTITKAWNVTLEQYKGVFIYPKNIVQNSLVLWIINNS